MARTSWDTPERGPAEEIVGRALKGRREAVVLATKVAAPSATGANGEGLNRKHIMEGVHESLRRLQTDYIDIYYLHEPDYTTPLEESLEAFERSRPAREDPLHRHVQLLRLAGLQSALAYGQEESRRHRLHPDGVQPDRPRQRAGDDQALRG